MFELEPGLFLFYEIETWGLLEKFLNSSLLTPSREFKK